MATLEPFLDVNSPKEVLLQTVKTQVKCSISPDSAMFVKLNKTPENEIKCVFGNYNL